MGKFSVKDEIANSLLELMQEKAYMEITVTDVVNRAGVARVSFYRNYSSISDVIDSFVEGIVEEFLKDVLPTLQSKDERMWRNFLFEFFYGFSKKQNMMIKMGVQNASVIFSRVNDRIQGIQKELDEETIQEKYTAIGKIGLINNVTKKWMDEGMKEAPEEMVNYIMSFILLF